MLVEQGASGELPDAILHGRVVVLQDGPQRGLGIEVPAAGERVDGLPGAPGPDEDVLGLQVCVDDVRGDSSG